MKLQPTLATIAFFIAISHASSIPEILFHSQHVATLATAFDNAIKNFPDTGVTSAEDVLGIHSNATSLAEMIDQGAFDVTNVDPNPISDADFTLILQSAEEFEPILVEALTAIVEKKSAFARLCILNFPDLIRQDLVSLKASTIKLLRALISIIPPDQQSPVPGSKPQVDAAFAKALDALANAQSACYITNY